MKKWVAAVMGVLCLVLGGSFVFLWMRTDRTPPEIEFTQEEKTYTESTSENELLDGVKAVDDEDGDVSGSLMVENIYQNEGGDTVTVVYTAKDSHNNVAKKNQVMKSEALGTVNGTPSEGQEPKNKAEQQDKSMEAAGGTKAADDIEGAKTADEPETAQEKGKKTGQETEQQLEEKAKSEQETAAKAMPAANPRLYLSKYYLKLAKGTPFEPLSYVKEITDDSDASEELWKRIQISGAADVNTPGSYALTYLVVDSQGNASNSAVLTVVVE